MTISGLVGCFVVAVVLVWGLFYFVFYFYFAHVESLTEYLYDLLGGCL